MRPRTKHISIKYHWFRKFVANKVVEILKIDTDYQPADIFTKNLAEVKFERFRKMINGW